LRWWRGNKIEQEMTFPENSTSLFAARASGSRDKSFTIVGRRPWFTLKTAGERVSPKDQAGGPVALWSHFDMIGEGQLGLDEQSEREDTTEDDLAHALRTGDAEWAAQVLLQAEAIGRHCLDTIASLLTEFPEGERGNRRFFPFRLKLELVRRRGRPPKQARHSPLYWRDGAVEIECKGEAGDELFQALAVGDAAQAAAILREARGIGQPWLGMLANHLLDSRRFLFRLDLVRRVGAPQRHDPSYLFSRERRLAAQMDRDLAATGRKKDAIHRAAEEFNVKSTTIYNAFKKHGRTAIGRTKA
jgi:hypothetical protein